MKWIVIIVAAVYLYMHYNQVEAVSLNEKHGADVIMYSTQSCGYCRKARVTMNLHGIKFKELDVERSSEANKEWRSLGGRGVPTFLIKGEVIKGYNPERVLELAQGI